jgi:hypothetical protein
MMPRAGDPFTTPDVGFETVCNGDETASTFARVMGAAERMNLTLLLSHGGMLPSRKLRKLKLRYASVLKKQQFGLGDK